ncbi:MAG: phosphoglycerate mutase family protein [Gammaproteobacteria bacterium]
MKKSNRSLRRRPLFTPVWLSLLGGLMFLLAVSWLWTSMGTVTVIFVRHADTVGHEDQRQLTEDGMQRAAALARLLQDVPLAAVYVNELSRTRATGEGVAKVTGAPLIELPSTASADLVRELKQHKGEIVLVVGHSNTVPELIRALGGTAEPISDTDFSQLLVLTTGLFDKTRVLRLNYEP